jgi:hypothetical protein
VSPPATLARELRSRAPRLEVHAMNGEVLVRGAAGADLPLLEELQGRHGARVVVLEEDAASCSRCGCTHEEACPGGCVWAQSDLCSRCVLDDEGGPRTPARPDGDEEEGDPPPDGGEEE